LTPSAPSTIGNVKRTGLRSPIGRGSASAAEEKPKSKRFVDLPELDHEIVSAQKLEEKYGEGTDDLCNDHE